MSENSWSYRKLSVKNFLLFITRSAYQDAFPVWSSVVSPSTNKENELLLNDPVRYTVRNTFTTLNLVMVDLRPHFQPYCDKVTEGVSWTPCESQMDINGIVRV